MSSSVSEEAVTAPKAPPLTIAASRGFAAWLAGRKAALAFTTYQVGKVFMVGLNAQDQLSVVERTFPRCMGMTVSDNGQSVWLSSLYQVWRLENFLDPGQEQDGYDRLYVPQASWVTGDIDIHDMALDAEGRLTFVSTTFSCLARLSETRSLEPIWKPRFISKLAAEDRCHLNGMAMEAGGPRYVTAVAETDVTSGWREHKSNGGVLVDVASGEVACGGLSMPHSPRLHQGKLYLHNSGTGEFGTVDLASGRFEPIAFCPGYLRGLAFSGRFAIVGLSRPRRDDVYHTLALQGALEQRKVSPRCGVMVIDLTTGDVVEWLEIDGVVVELYDVALVPETRRPMVIGTRGDDIRRLLRFDLGE